VTNGEKLAVDDTYTAVAGIPLEATIPVTANDVTLTGSPLG
jgi:hypothetical protein